MQDSQEGWIVGTSGHRAYPFRRWSFNELHTQINLSLYDEDKRTNYGEEWNAWPDHYPANKAPLE